MQTKKLNAMPTQSKKELYDSLQNVTLPLNYDHLKNIQKEFEHTTGINLQRYGISGTPGFALFFTKLYRGLVNSNVSLFANPDADRLSETITIDYTTNRQNYKGELI